MEQSVKPEGVATKKLHHGMIPEVLVVKTPLGRFRSEAEHSCKQHTESPPCLVEDFDNFSYCFVFVFAMHCLDSMLFQVTFQNYLVNRTYGGLHSERLLEDIDAIFFGFNSRNYVLQVSPSSAQSFKSIGLNL
jgi:hypothetical protein